MKVKKVVGVIGGMGPMATCYLMEDIVRLTCAHTDQEHVHVCVDCNSNIPDRTDAILHHGASPVPELVKSGIRLESMGADVLVMPCNTAHYFYEQLVPYFDVPLLHMLRETAREIKRRRITKVGLMATDGTLASGIYKQVLEEEQIQLAVPSPENQKYVMQLIYDGVKAGRKPFDVTGIYRAVRELSREGAQALLLGCTELPIAFEQYHIEAKVIDPLRILAEASIRYVGAPLSE